MLLLLSLPEQALLLNRHLLWCLLTQCLLSLADEFSLLPDLGALQADQCPVARPRKAPATAKPASKAGGFVYSFCRYRQQSGEPAAVVAGVAESSMHVVLADSTAAGGSTPMRGCLQCRWKPLHMRPVFARQESQPAMDLQDVKFL